MPGDGPDSTLIKKAENDYSKGLYGDFVNDLRMLEVQTKGNIASATDQMTKDGIIPKIVISCISDRSVTNHDVHVEDNGTLVCGPYAFLNGKSSMDDPFDGYSNQSPESGITPTQDVNPTNIDQAQNGDCAFLATMASLASTDAGRQAILGMITVNGSDYSVKFPGSDQTISVTRADISSHNLKNSATWANILEAAFIKLNGGPEAQVDVPMHLLTGHDTAKTDKFHPLDYTQPLDFNSTPRDEFVADLISHSGTDGNMLAPVVTSTYPNGPIASILGVNSGPFAQQHAWTLLSYDKANDIVTIRNPWGHAGLGSLSSADGSIKDLGDGDIQMSVDTLMKYFVDVKFS